jgi:hypothetical protein
MLVRRFRGDDVTDVEIFTPTGVIAGTTARVPLSHDGPDLSSPLALDESHWYPIDGGRPIDRGEVRIDPDDILLVVTPEPELRVHLAWYAVRIEIGPYRVSASLGTQPGFDPERALSRPGGTFIELRDATIELLDAPEPATAQRPHLHVNRYAVDRVVSMLMLGFYFPGARLVAGEPGALNTETVEPGAARTPEPGLLPVA